MAGRLHPSALGGNDEDKDGDRQEEAANAGTLAHGRLAARTENKTTAEETANATD